MIESKSLRQVTDAVNRATEWTVLSTSSSNSAHTATRPTEPGKNHYITMFEVTLRGGTAQNDTAIEIKTGNTTVWKTFIGSGSVRGERVGIVFQKPLKVSGSAAIYVASAGSDCVTESCLGGFTS